MHVNPSISRRAARSSFFSGVIGYGAVTAILIASSIKNNTSDIANSEWWGAYQDASIIVFLKSQNTTILILSALLLMFGALRSAKMVPLFRHATLLLLTFYLYIIIRTLVPASGLAMKFTLSFLVALGMAFNLYYTWASENIEDSARRMFYAITIAAFWIVLVNFYNVLTGNGRVPGFNRLIGVGGHPNFTGVQLALGTPFLLMGALRRRSIWVLVFGGALAINLYLLLMTGSRTAILTASVAVIVAVSIRFKLSLSQFAVFSMSGLVLAALFLYLLSLTDLMHVGSDSLFYRGENTRAGTFAYLLQSISESPFSGLGRFEGLPENSLLRAWAAFGLGTPLFLLAIPLAALFRFRKLVWASKSLTYIAAIAGCFAGLIMGSLTEGYLVDAFSYPMLTFCVLTIFSDRAESVRLRVAAPSIESSHINFGRSGNG